MKKSILVLSLALIAAGVFAQDIALSKPPAKIGVDILDAIRSRAAARAFVKRDVSVADLSAIVWAGNGLKGAPDAVSAASKAAGTIPVSGDVNYVNIYILTAKGVYRYDPVGNLLKQVGKKDARGDITTENIANAAFMVLFTYDGAKLPSFVKGNPAGARDMGMGTASYAAQNVGLVAASLKLGSIIMYNIKPDVAASAAGLTKDEVPLFIMQVGYVQ